MGSETREIVMAFSREFGETESPPRWDMKMERCLGRWLKGPLFLFELQSEVVMRNRLVLLAALMWCLSGVAAAAPAMDIVLYPSSAQVQVDDTLPVKNGAVAFVVPAGTDLESLVISLDKGEVISRRAIPVLVADSETVAALRQDLAEARAHAAGLEGEAAAVAARISLWSTGALAQEVSMAEMEKLDAAMPERLKALYVQAAALEPQVKEAREGVARLEQALSEYGDAATGTQVEAQVGDLSGNVRVRYSYMLSGCGWSPAYRFDAEPEKGLVRFTQQAEIRQATGQDWKGVHLTLASADPGSGLQPGSLPNWTLRKVEHMPRALAASPVMEQAAMDAAPNMMMKAAPPVDVREMATFAAWDLGTRTVPAGRPVLFELARGDWKASFVRLARPGYGGKAAWLMAEVRLPEAVDWPHGPAQYSVDGLPVGAGTFALSGDHEDMFFGRDSRVTVDMKQDLRQSGSKGFVGKRQTRDWKWTIEVTNSHTQPVAVRVEDPEPQIGDSAIEVKVVAKPAPVVKDHVNTWNLTVPASGKSVIDYTVEASAPEDMRLIYGR